MNKMMIQMIHLDVCYGGLDGSLGVRGGVWQIESFCVVVNVDYVVSCY